MAPSTPHDVCAHPPPMMCVPHPTTMRTQCVSHPTTMRVRTIAAGSGTLLGSSGVSGCLAFGTASLPASGSCQLTAAAGILHRECCGCEATCSPARPPATPRWPVSHGLQLQSSLWRIPMENPYGESLLQLWAKARACWAEMVRAGSAATSSGLFRRDSRVACGRTRVRLQLQQGFCTGAAAVSHGSPGRIVHRWLQL